MSETAADAILSIEQLTLALPADADRAFAVEAVCIRGRSFVSSVNPAPARRSAPPL